MMEHECRRERLARAAALQAIPHERDARAYIDRQGFTREDVGH